jgi:hypothetical protein
MNRNSNYNNNKSRGNKKQKRREQGNVSSAPSSAELLNQGLSSKR